jgi:hypothetical protein
MDMKRKAARGIAVLAVALAAGHLVQNMGDKKASPAKASAELAVKPAKVETIAAGPELAPKADAAQPAAPALTVAPMAAGELPLVPKAAEQPAIAEADAPLAAKPATAETVVTDACNTTLDLMAEPNAMIGITLVAPCQPNQRVVLRQGGLVVTAMTTSTGALFTAVPAFETLAVVEVAFTDGEKHSAEIAVPELANLRRFGVQWQADDAFQVHAFENGASYGEPGHISAVDPNRPLAGMPAKGGFMTLAGDSTTENPLLAEVYTYPADPTAKPEIVVEAAVTEKTCGRELLAETLSSMGGTLFVTDLTLAMPECDAIGDYLVLKNLVLDLNMAAAN